jgi:hypothetical protein
VLTIGVDEAGYGPLLGPLVLGACAFRLWDVTEPGTVDLRRRLRGLVVQRPRSPGTSDRRLPVPIDDSKRIHQRFGLEGLARGVGLFAAALDVAPPADLEDLLLRFSERGPEAFRERPWYAGLGEARLPRYPWTGPLAERFGARGVEALDLRVLPLDAADLNVEFESQGNKARVLGLAAGACLLALLDRYPAEDAEIVLDRQGGRLDYAQYLADLFPFASITPRAAPRGEARYDLQLPDRRLFVRVATGADRASLAVGWASMAAKLVRELFMQRLNAFFLARRPDVRATAGYHTDGLRFLGEVASVIEAEGVDRRELVRSR